MTFDWILDLPGSRDPPARSCVAMRLPSRRTPRWRGPPASCRSTTGAWWQLSPRERLADCDPHPPAGPSALHVGRMRASLWRRRSGTSLRRPPLLWHRQHGSGRKAPSTRRCPSPAPGRAADSTAATSRKSATPGGRPACGDRRGHIFGHTRPLCDRIPVR